MNRIPLFIRKFFVDFAETAVGALLALNLAFPTSIDELKALAAAAGMGALAALVSAARRAAPDALAALKAFVLGGE
jgi:hypothetical protein